MDVEEMLGRAEALVKSATNKGADQAEVYLSQGTSVDVEVEAGRLAGAGHSGATGGAIRVIKDNKLGFAYFTSEDRAGKAIDYALQQSKLSIDLPMTFPAAAPYGTSSPSWDERLADLDVAIAIEAAQAIIDGGKEAPDATVAGGVGLSCGAEAIANSEGTSVGGRATMMQAFASLVQPDADSNVNCWDSQSSHNLLDTSELTQTVTATARSLCGATAAKTGRADVVLLPSAGSELVTGLILDAVHGDSAVRGKSFWSDKLDQTVAHTGFRFLDAPLHPDAISGTSYDGEGRAVSDQALIERGTLKSFMFNTRDGARHQRPATAHASRDGFKAPPGTGAHHIVLEHDVALPMDKLLGDIDTGYLVESVLGAHTANSTTGDFSVTAANVWHVRNGAVAGACKEVAIGGNLPELLMRLDGVGDAPKATSGSRIPAMRFRDVQVSA